MLRSLDENTGRTPKHDAPPYDPSVWEGKDCAFITTLKHIHHEQQRLERHLQSETFANGAGSTLPSVSHAHLTHYQTTWWGKLLMYLFPKYYAKQAWGNLEFSRVSTDELVGRMHFALQAGNTAVSSLIAQELARRRASLFDERVEERGAGWRRRSSSSGNGGVRGAASMSDARFRAASKGRYSSSNGGAGNTSLGRMTFRGGAKPFEDASCVVPEILLQRRSVGGD